MHTNYPCILTVGKQAFILEVPPLTDSEIVLKK